MSSFFESYELTQTLREQAHGSLHRARDRNTNALVLLQRPSASLSVEEGRNHLLRELGVLSQLTAVAGVAKVVRLHHGSTGDALVLSYFPGVSLADKVKPGLEFSQVLAWALQAVEVLAAVHSAGFLHRNLSPSSFLVGSGGELLLNDFGLASPLAEERRAAGSPDPVHDWAYLAPEQTGRIHSTLDARTDFYALGMLLYTLTEGKPAFTCATPLEAIHAHLAKVPQRPLAGGAEWGDFVLKLLAKAPEQRYQSAAGLLADLRTFSAQWKESGKLSPFPLGSEDRTDQLRFSRKLFGRASERALLREAYDQTVLGSREIVVLCGPSGVGKSALAAEAGSWALSDQGFFLTGKYDSQRDQPYGAVIQQVEDLVRQILLGNELAYWKRAFAETLGENQAVISALVPAFTAIAGPQPPPQPLSPRETENRFFYTVETFLKILRGRDRSVVLFFDDLQWVDAASARLLGYLREQPDRRHLLVLYSYREEEGSAVFQAVLNQLNASLTRPLIRLGALDQQAVALWLNELLGSPLRSAELLAQTLLAKTAGSPFFLTQLVKRIHREGILFFDRAQGRWEWNAAKLAALPASENVGDLLMGQFQTLPPSSATLLELASCLGTTLYSSDLLLFQDEIPDLGAALWPLINLQYFVPLSDGYLSLGASGRDAGLEVPAFSLRFQHDRIRDAAYHHQSEAVRAERHWKAGQRLEASKPMEAAGHYLLVLDRLSSAADRLRVTELMVRVGTQARASSATQQALSFFRQARRLEDGALPRARHRDLMLQHAETAYVCRELEEAEAVGRELLAEAASPEEKAEVAMMQMESYTFLQIFDEAQVRGTRAMAELGRSLSLKPNPLQLAFWLLKVLAKTARRPHEALYRRQGSVSHEISRLLRLLGKFLVPAQMSGNTNLFVLSTLMAADLALDHGNSTETSGAFGNFAILLSVLGRHRQAFEFATLALRLEEALPNPKTAAAVHSAYSFFSLPWNRPWGELPPAALRGADVARRTGDLFFMAYQPLFAAVFSPPATLGESTEALAQTLASIATARQDGAVVGGTFALQRWRALAGELRDPADFSRPGFDELALVRGWEQAKNQSGLAVYHSYKVQVFFHLGRYAEAWSQWVSGLPTAASILGSAYMEEYAVYTALVCAEAAFSSRTRARALKHLAAERRRVEGWARTAGQNFGALAALLKGEELAARGRPAEKWFAAALAQSDTVHLHWKALIHERAAQYHLRRGDRAFSRYLMVDAHALYARWGAKEVLLRLESSYPDWGLSRHPVHAPAWDSDTASLWKVSQVISREIDVDKLRAVVVQAVVENAGARRGWLLVKTGGEWEVSARGDAEGQGQAFVTRVTPESEGIPPRILEEAEQRPDGLLITSALRDPRFSSDAVVEARKLKSVVALPFSPPGSELQALWYLENDLVEGAFSFDRLDGLRLLSGQVGISLENARIYRALTELNRDLEGRVNQRTAELEERNRQHLHSVEYAAVLQRSLLPRDWGRAVADRFVLWAPKDLVGGDLYWFRESEDSCLLALIDCTGHGVPGSLITMLVHSILTDAAASSAPGDLDAILSKANQQFRRALGQNLPGSESNDGFEMGLLWWRPEGDLRFAGARISLIHPTETGLAWLHGGRRALGYHQTPEFLSSTVHTIPRRPGARYYMTTDGYLGQVGGEKDISFGRDRLTGLLAQTASLPMEEQGLRLKKALEDYRGPRPQADDITVVGVQLR